MENQVVMKDVTEVSIQFQEAIDLHQRIITNAFTAASSLVEMCKCLKQMRDRKQYIHLGYNSFDEYAENMAKIKARQAYNYISAFERLGPEVLQLNANLGITKLQLLSEIPEAQREDVIANNDIEEMSTREVKELVEQLTKAQEQISLFQEEITKKQEDIETAQSERDKAAEESAELRRSLEEQKKAIPEERSYGNFRKDIEAKHAEEIKALEKKAESEKKEAIRKAEEKAKKAVEDEKAKEIAAAEEQVRKTYEKRLNEIAKEKDESDLRAKDLEKKLSVAGNSDVIVLDLLFGEFSQGFERILQKLNGMPEDDRYRAAVKKALGIMIEKL